MAGDELLRARVVIVDDNELLLGAVRRFLARHCELRGVAGQAEACEVIATWEPDAVVTDLRLGDDDRGGLTVLEAAAASAPGARRILMSGAEPPLRAHALAHHVIRKPLEPADLLSVLGLGQA